MRSKVPCESKQSNPLHPDHWGKDCKHRVGIRITEEMVDRFLSWELPASVCSDPCASMSGYTGKRWGTNLLTAAEARMMLEYVLRGEDLK